ncbi:hypothetical protein QQ045_028455 [Rhodiola kirilowii]
MAIAANPFGFAQLPRPLIYCLGKVRNGSSVTSAVDFSAGPTCVIKENSQVSIKKAKGDDELKMPEWKMLNSEDLGLRSASISKPTRLILNELRKKGYTVYLVGGCVRDLILKKTPKDFDIITSAELKEILKTFPRCEIVGKRFPICHVHIGDTVVEVSSFSTTARKSDRRISGFKIPYDCNEHDYLRWKNCLRRDFTINGLMFDPYEKIVYDYMGGLDDIKKAKVRTVIPANMSFVEDCARILRAFRIAARLRFSFTKDLARSVRELSGSILRLDKGRILMEMNYMLAYGSAEASLRLLWRFGFMELLLPVQASYFVSQGFKRRDERSNMLLALLSTLDTIATPDQPCQTSLWVGLLAFHQALVDKPRDPVVIAAFSLSVHSGGSLAEAVNIARRISQPYDSSFTEVLESGSSLTNSSLLDEIVDLQASVEDALSKMADESFVSHAMSKYPQAPFSDVVFISFALLMRVRKIFECVSRGKRGTVSKRGSRTDYDSSAPGSLNEVRRLFARIVFDTVYPPKLNSQAG